MVNIIFVLLLILFPSKFFAYDPSQLAYDSSQINNKTGPGFLQLLMYQQNKPMKYCCQIILPPFYNTPSSNSICYAQNADLAGNWAICPFGMLPFSAQTFGAGQGVGLICVRPTCTWVSADTYCSLTAGWDASTLEALIAKIVVFNPCIYSNHPPP